MVYYFSRTEEELCSLEEMLGGAGGRQLDSSGLRDGAWIHYSLDSSVEI